MPAGGLFLGAFAVFQLKASPPDLTSALQEIPKREDWEERYVFKAWTDARAEIRSEEAWRV